MTLTLADAITVIEVQTKLIKQQSIEITELEYKLEQKEHNRRYTNKKFIDSTPLVGLEPKSYLKPNPKKVDKTK
jgi:hypothetical protein